MWCPVSFLAASAVYHSHQARIPNLLISSTYFKVGPTVNEKPVMYSCVVWCNVIPQTYCICRDPGGFVRGQCRVRESLGMGTRQLLCGGAVLGDTYAHLAYAKWSVA